PVPTLQPAVLRALADEDENEDDNAPESDNNEDSGDVGSGRYGDLEKQYDPETEDPIIKFMFS
ncbi:TPA: hypothetical protein N2G48_003494, partial [Salmonella enterica]|nr:hypothetical protein [Salmonella enterica]